jgi:hypothetical protein
VLELVENILVIILSGAVYTVTFVITLWIAGAVCYDVGGGATLGRLLMLAWLAAVAAVFLYLQPLWQPFLLLLIFFMIFLVWWRSQKPSHHRNWNPNFAVLPSIAIDSDRVTIQNVRNTDYRTLEDFTTNYETRQYHLSKLVGIDAAVIYWGSTWISHPMLIFDFGEDGRICFSIEVRYREGQKYGFLRSLYRQQEIIYLVSDERDAILKRSKYSKNHDVYLYRLKAAPEEIQRVFLEYVVSTNDLAEYPSWYNGLTTNCTTSIYRQRGNQVEWDWRWLFNGRLDQMIYDHGRLSSNMPFEELKQKSWVNDIANHAPTDNFGDHVRQELPAYSQEDSR